jgi:Kdo2-lipid IVA lauroyltransferase/acyltransferase
MKPVARHRIEYGALRVALGAFSMLGWRRASNFGASLAGMGYRPLGIRRGVVERQVAAAFPGLGEQDVLRIARESYGHLGRTSVEAALLPTMKPEGVLDLFEPADTWNVVEQAASLGKGIIFVTGHLGNWELIGAYIAARGIPLEAVARRMENPIFDAFLTRTRERLGMRIMPDSEAVRRTPRALREGHGVGFLVDQGVLGLASTYVPFFGRPAKTPRGPAVFALRLGAPVVFTVALRQPNGRYQPSFERVEAPVTGDRDTDVDAIVAEYTKVLERWVRRAPEQYFWHHRRWKWQPKDTPPELREP